MTTSPTQTCENCKGNGGQGGGLFGLIPWAPCPICQGEGRVQVSPFTFKSDLTSSRESTLGGQSSNPSDFGASTHTQVSPAAKTVQESTLVGEAKFAKDLERDQGGPTLTPEGMKLRRSWLEDAEEMQRQHPDQGEELGPQHRTADGYPYATFNDNPVAQTQQMRAQELTGHAGQAAAQPLGGQQATAMASATNWEGQKVYQKMDHAKLLREAKLAARRRDITLTKAIVLAFPELNEDEIIQLLDNGRQQVKDS